MKVERTELHQKRSVTVVLLSSPVKRTRERIHYVDAFERAGHSVLEWLPQTITNGGLARLISLRTGEIVVLHPEQEPTMPRDLPSVPVPTACFHIDTFRHTDRRVQWSLAFDHAFVFHPGFDSLFTAAGHKSATVLPHAVDSLSCKSARDKENGFELGWVGETNGPHHSRRRRVLPMLSNRFVMNDWRGRYTEADALAIYRQSRIVVNIGRDDWPQDANLRVFEAMGSGALLITSLPSELTSLGFVDGHHFLGYGEESDLEPLIHELLSDEERRRAIAEAGRDLVRREHTYDRRIETILAVLRSRGHLDNRYSENEAWFDWVQFDYSIGHHAWMESITSFLRLVVRHPVSALSAILILFRRRLVLAYKRARAS